MSYDIGDSAFGTVLSSGQPYLISTTDTNLNALFDQSDSPLGVLPDLSKPKLDKMVSNLTTVHEDLLAILDALQNLPPSGGITYEQMDTLLDLYFTKYFSTTFKETCYATDADPPGEYNIIKSLPYTIAEILMRGLWNVMPSTASSAENLPSGFFDAVYFTATPFLGSLAPQPTSVDGNPQIIGNVDGQPVPGTTMINNTLTQPIGFDVTKQFGHSAFRTPHLPSEVFRPWLFSHDNRNFSSVLAPQT